METQKNKIKRTAPKVFLDYKNTQNTTERTIKNKGGDNWNR